MLFFYLQSEAVNTVKAVFRFLPARTLRAGSLILIVLFFLLSALAAESKASDPPSDKWLLARVRILEQTLFLRQRPDDGPLLERIALLEGLEETEKPARIKAIVPGLAQSSVPVQAEDGGDWRSYPDFERERRAVEETFASFKGALRAGDIEKAASLVDEGRKDIYSALFAHRPEAMASFADLLDGAEMTFLSDPEEADSSASSTCRTIEYAVDMDGFTFYVRWIKMGEKWVLFDF